LKRLRGGWKGGELGEGGMGWMVDRDRYRDRIGGVEGRTRKEMDMGGRRTGS
jgi:hypothetical protein